MAELHLPPDYSDLLRELDDAGAEYVLVGGWAVAVHGHGRATDDLDVFVRATPDNAERVYRALARFGAPLSAHGITPGHFAGPHYGYRVGQKPLLIEILTTIDGIDFDEAIREALRVSVDGVSVPVIGRAALVANKRAAGRHKDLADLEALAAIEPTRDTAP